MATMLLTAVLQFFCFFQSDGCLRKYHFKRDAFVSLADSSGIITIDLGKLDKSVYSIRMKFIGMLQSHPIVTKENGRDCANYYETSSTFFGVLLIHFNARPRTAKVSRWSSSRSDTQHELKNLPMYLYDLEGHVLQVNPSRC